MSLMPKNICFVIASYYVRTHATYLYEYIDRIKAWYPLSLVLVVDNNSRNIVDHKTLFLRNTNVLLAVNDSICKFEIGAYKYGIQFLAKHGFLEHIDYIVFSQDTFVLNNPFNVEELALRRTYACAFNHYYGLCDMPYDPLVEHVLRKLDLVHLYDGFNFNLCWCSSFILHTTRALVFYEILKDLCITSRAGGSVQGERFLAGVLFYLNNRKFVSLCGDMSTPTVLGYDCWTVNPANNSLPHYFVKSVQQKTEATVDDSSIVRP